MTYAPRTLRATLAGMAALAVVLAAGLAQAGNLYFPHVVADGTWDTEIGVVNNGIQSLTGSLKGYGPGGAQVAELPVSLPPHGRLDLSVAAQFQNAVAIAYMVLETVSNDGFGFAKYSIHDLYRAAVPAARSLPAGTLHLPHIAADAIWSTGIALTNLSGQARTVTFQFNTGQTADVALAAGEHKALLVSSLIAGDISALASAEIVGAAGVVGVAVYATGSQLTGLALSEATGDEALFPQVVSGPSWKTGVVVYNPGASTVNVLLKPYDLKGQALPTISRSVGPKGKLVGETKALGLPANTAWFLADAAGPVVGMEIFLDGQNADGFGVTGGTALSGVLPKKLAGASTVLGFVNPNFGFVNVELTLYRDNGQVVAQALVPLAGRNKALAFDDEVFTGQDISQGTWIAYTANAAVTAFQVNQSPGWKEVDALMAMH